MTYTIAQRDALEQAIASGVLSVSYNGNTVNYRTISELKEALAKVEKGLALQGNKPQTRQVKIYAEKDL